MSIVTDLTRMWLTRSFKPFVFKNEYDEQLPFSETRDIFLGFGCSATTLLTAAAYGILSVLDIVQHKSRFA